MSSDGPEPKPYTLKRFDRLKRTWLSDEYDSLDDAKLAADNHNAAAEVWLNWKQVYKAS